MVAFEWDFDRLSMILASKEPKKKFYFTDSQDEFINRMEEIANTSFKSTNDNLRYLEQLDKIKQIREGADIYEVYTWLKDKQC